MLHYFTLGWW